MAWHTMDIVFIIIIIIIIIQRTSYVDYRGPSEVCLKILQSCLILFAYFWRVHVLTWAPFPFFVKDLVSL